MVLRILFLKHAECFHSRSGGNNDVHCEHGHRWNWWNTYRTRLCAVLSAKWIIIWRKRLHKNLTPMKLQKCWRNCLVESSRNLSNQTVLQNKCLSKVAKAADEIGFDSSWIIFERCANGQQIHAWEKCGVGRFGLFIVVRYVRGRRVNSKTFLGTTSKWKDLRKCLPRPSGQRIVVQPHKVFFVLIVLSFVSSCQLLPDPCLGQMQKKVLPVCNGDLTRSNFSTPNIL